jgi:hypothetical protein
MEAVGGGIGLESVSVYVAPMELVSSVLWEYVSLCSVKASIAIQGGRPGQQMIV